VRGRAPLVGGERSIGPSKSRSRLIERLPLAGIAAQAWECGVRTSGRDEGERSQGILRNVLALAVARAQAQRSRGGSTRHRSCRRHWGLFCQQSWPSRRVRGLVSGAGPGDHQLHHGRPTRCIAAGADGPWISTTCEKSGREPAAARWSAPVAGTSVQIGSPRMGPIGCR